MLLCFSSFLDTVDLSFVGTVGLSFVGTKLTYIYKYVYNKLTIKFKL